VGLGSDEAPPAQHPPYRRNGRDRPVTVAQVVVDGLGSGIKSQVRELLAQRDDLVLELHRSAVGNPFGRTRARLDGLVAAGSEPTHHLADPALRHPVGSGHLPVAPSLQDHRVHHVASQIPHRGPPLSVSTMLRYRCPLCGELRHSRAHWI
jgi:hypothetical protein